MAKDIVQKKRKASASETDLPKSKTKKTAVGEDLSGKKRKATEDAFPTVIKKTKTPKDSKNDLTQKISQKVSKDSSTKSNGHATKKTKGGEEKSTKKIAEIPQQIDIEEANTLENTEQPLSDGEEDEEIDDQTIALLKGFEDSDEEDESEITGGLNAGEEVPQIPELTSKHAKKLQKISESTETPEKPGAVYVGRIPHGFYEKEMREYFKQFGTILNLRISRNPKTGASRHFAFIQFESAEVATIVSKAMDNYLLFGHLLKVKVIPEEQVHAEMFKGANRSFKKVPWAKIEGRRLAQGASEAKWRERNAKEELKRKQKAEKLKEIGYEFNAPTLKAPTAVARAPAEAIEDEPSDAPGGSAKMSVRDHRAHLRQAMAEFTQEHTSDAEDAVTEAVVAKEPRQSKSEKEKKSKMVEDINTASDPSVKTVKRKSDNVLSQPNAEGKRQKKIKSVA